MPTIIERGDGVRTTFGLPIHTKSATATVNGSNATVSSQADSSVTFTTAPAAGSVVAITYTPASGVRSPVEAVLGSSGTVTGLVGTGKGLITKPDTFNQRGNFMLKPSKPLYDITSASNVLSVTNTTLQYEGTVRRWGNQTLKVVATADGNTQVRKGSLSLLLDPVDKLLQFGVYIPTIVGTGRVIQVTITNSSSYSANNDTFSFNGNYLRQGWNTIKIWGDDTDSNGVITANMGMGKLALGSARKINGTGMNYSLPIGYFEITVISALAGETWYFDQLRLGGKAKTFAIIGFDATSSGSNDAVMTDKVAPLFASYGYKGYVTATWIYDLMYWGTASDKRMDDLYERFGWDVINHFWNHGPGAPGTTGAYTRDVINADNATTREILRHEIADMQKLILARGFTRARRCGAYPNNSVGELAVHQYACKESGVDFFRGYAGSTIKLTEHGIDNPINFGSIEMGSGARATTVTQFTDALDGAIGRGESLMTYGHYVLDEVTLAPGSVVDINSPPGTNGNANPPGSGAEAAGGWWYLGQVKAFLDAVKLRELQGKLVPCSYSEFVDYVS